MKLAFLIDSPVFSGGMNVIFEHALYAQETGEDVFIVCSRPFTQGNIDWHPRAGDLNWIPLNDVGNQFFDIAVATWWRTAFDLSQIKARNYVYFVQQIESRLYPQKARIERLLADSSYTLPIHYITEVSWIHDYLADTYGQDSELAHNGIHKDIFSLAGTTITPRINEKLRVLIEGSVDVPFKNVKESVEIAQNSEADEIWLMTSTDVKSFPGVDKVFSRVPVSKTPDIYRACDVLLKLSKIEGMFGPPLEMFHCGGTAITYNVSGYDEYMQHGVNSLVAEMGNKKEVTQYLNNLKKSPELLNRLKKEALTTAEKWPSWPEASARFLDILRMFMTMAPTNRTLLNEMSLILLKWELLAQEYRWKTGGLPLHHFARFLDNHPKLYEMISPLWTWMPKNRKV